MEHFAALVLTILLGLLLSSISKYATGLGSIPIYSLVLAFASIGIFGAAYSIVFGAMTMGVSLVVTLLDSEVYDGLVFWLVSVNAFALGALSCFKMFGSVASPHFAIPQTSQSLSAGSILPSSPIAALVLSALSVSALVFGVGVETYTRAQDYLMLERPVLRSLASMLFPIASFCVGYAFGSAKTLATKVLTLGLALLLVFVLLMTASRGAAIVSVFCVVGYLYANRQITSGKATLALLGAALVGLQLLVIALFLRSLPEHGLIPYSAALFELVTGAESLDTLFVDALDSTAGNLLFGFPLSVTVHLDNPDGLPLTSLLTQLNPLPGFLTNWYDLVPELRLNFYTPYPLMGELYSYGYPVSITFFLLYGFSCSMLGRECNSMLARGRRIVPLVVVASLLIFVPLATQYNMRSCLRAVYYAATLLMCVKLMELLRQARKSALVDRLRI